MFFLKRRQFLTVNSLLVLILLITVIYSQFLINNKTVTLAASPTELTISAAASLKDALETIKPIYIKENSKVKLIYNFASSGSLQQQIEQGAPVDVFISAAPKQMNALQKKNLIKPETRYDLLSNQMVLIVTKDNNKIKKFADLKTAKFNKLALGEPESVPAGKYSQEVLEKLGLFQVVKPKIVYGKDVRQVLNYVATGNAEVGMVYRTDVKASDRVKIVDTAPKNSHSPIIYPIAVIKSSANPEIAKRFVIFLRSEKAQKVFKDYGFIPIKSNS
jgi:molybdate transport system substrate-binding protein